ncbi:RuBisCO large subunit C-terminal-like domain-containing protein [Fibrobacterota bacterium]
MNGTQSRFSVTYRVSVRDGRSIREHLEDIALEQTAEAPRKCIPEQLIRDGILGSVHRIKDMDESNSVYEAVISYRNDISSFSVPQLLNVLYGNISLKDNIKLTGLSLPEDFQGVFPGPGTGIEGLRKILGVYRRPLACTALKPMGLSCRQLAEMAGAFAEGGIDLIKDDHGISDQPFSPFKERTTLCQQAVERANGRTGRKTLYLPMISGKFDEIEDHVRHAVQLGIRGILIAPMLAGPDTVRYLSQKYGLLVMAHPAMTGTFFHSPWHGMTPAFLLGTLFRLIGADISVFPNAGGRFHFTQEQCEELTEALLRPDHGWKRTFPCPAGGMRLDRIASMIEEYGEDTVLLIGGNVMLQGKDLTKGAKVFMEKIRSCSGEELVEPLRDTPSSCEAGSSAGEAGPAELLKFSNYTWAGRSIQEYKPEDIHDYKGIYRQELVGIFGEKTKFDLRYFEIMQGGYSSLERHAHEHVIIGARGRGLLLKGSREFPVHPHDIAYVSPLEKHQLVNRNSEPFGFFCIVDHRRDRPVQG